MSVFSLGCHVSLNRGSWEDGEVLLQCRLLKNKLDKEELLSIVTEAVEIEKEFVCEALPVDLIGMNKALMSQYIDFVADRLLVALGQDKHYNTPNPFDWMEMLSLQCAPPLTLSLSWTSTICNRSTVDVCGPWFQIFVTLGYFRHHRQWCAHTV